jgi:5-methylcytosine-specific restriction endonuclease McrA
MNGHRFSLGRLKKYTKRRPKIDPATEDSILVRSQHRCCICYAEGVQIAHADDDRNNNEEDNLIPLCLRCHDKVSKKGGMTRGYTPEQLRMYKRRWFDEVQLARKRAALGLAHDRGEEENLPEASVNLESEDSG